METTSPPPSVRKMSAWWFALPALLLIGACIAGPVLIFTPFFKGLSTGTQFLAPGTQRITINEPQSLVLLVESISVYNGQSFMLGSPISVGGPSTMTNVATGETITMRPMAMSYTENMGATVRYGLGTFDVPKAGDYDLNVPGTFASHPFFVRRSIWDEFGTQLVAGIAIAMACGVGALISGIIILVKFVRSRRRVMPPPIIAA